MSGWTSDADLLPPVPGAYALLVEVRIPVTLPPRCVASELLPGRYVYVGSANGPGGIRARCRRHLRAEKPIHWHIDRLTVGAEPGRNLAVAFPGKTECTLAAALRSGLAEASPVLGFGNTDCKSCQAHLFDVGAHAEPEVILQVLSRIEA